MTKKTAAKSAKPKPASKPAAVKKPAATLAQTMASPRISAAQKAEGLIEALP